MGAAENYDVVSRVYQAMAAGDRDALRELHTDDVVLHVSGAGPTAGDYRGIDAVIGLAANTPPTGDSTTVVHDLLASDDHVVALVRASVVRDGETLEQSIVQVVHVRDGRVAEIWEYLWDQRGDAIFWSHH